VEKDKILNGRKWIWFNATGEGGRIVGERHPLVDKDR
jgi:hypothetical protein